MNAIMERLLREEKEAEVQMYGEEPAEEQALPTIEEEVETAPEEESSEDTSTDTDDTEPQQKRVNWKKRFIGYKTSTDETLASLRREVVSLRQENEDLRDEVAKLQKQLYELQKRTTPVDDPLADVFTQEDVDLLGPEAIAAMKKAALAGREVKPDPRVDKLEKELRDTRRRELERAKAEAAKSDAEAKQFLRDKLEELIPNFEKVDEDPRFAKFLQDVDPLSNRVRMNLFAAAVNTLDVAGVARFYRDFINGRPGSFTDEFISPTGDGATQSNPDRDSRKIHRLSDYEKFMDDVTKGRYRGREKEARKLELMYDKAYQEGRLVE